MDSSMNSIPIDLLGFSGPVASHCNVQPPPGASHCNVQPPPGASHCNVPPRRPPYPSSRSPSNLRQTLPTSTSSLNHQQTLPSLSLNHQQNLSQPNPRFGCGPSPSKPGNNARISPHPSPSVILGPRHPTILYPKTFMFPTPGEMPRHPGVPPGAVLPPFHHQQHRHFRNPLQPRSQGPNLPHNYPYHQQPTSLNQRPQPLFRAFNHLNAPSRAQNYPMPSHNIGKSNIPATVVSSCSPVRVIRRTCPPPINNFPSASNNHRPAENVDMNQNRMENSDSELRAKSGLQLHLNKTGQELARMCFSVEVGCQTDLSFPSEQLIAIMPVGALDDVISVGDGERNKNEPRKNEVNWQPDVDGTDSVASIVLTGENNTENKNNSKQPTFVPNLNKNQLKEPFSIDNYTACQELPEFEDLDKVIVKNDLQTSEILKKEAVDIASRYSSMEAKKDTTDNSAEMSSLTEKYHKMEQEKLPKHDNENIKASEANILSIDAKLTNSANKVSDQNPNPNDSQDLKIKQKTTTNSSNLCDDIFSLNNDCEETVNSFNPLANFTTLMSFTDPYIESELSEMFKDVSNSSEVEVSDQYYYSENANYPEYYKVAIPINQSYCQDFKQTEIDHWKVPKHLEDKDKPRIEATEEGKTSSTIICRNPRNKNVNSQKKLSSRELCQKPRKKRSITESPESNDRFSSKSIDPQASTSKNPNKSSEQTNKEKLEQKCYPRQNLKPDIATRMSFEQQRVNSSNISTKHKPWRLSEKISTNWNMSLMDSLNTTEKCGYVSGITSLKKYKVHEQPEKKQNAAAKSSPDKILNDGLVKASPAPGNEHSSMSQEKRSSRGRLLKKKRFHDYEESTTESKSDKCKDSGSLEESSNVNSKDSQCTLVERKEMGNQYSQEKQCRKTGVNLDGLEIEGTSLVESDKKTTSQINGQENNNTNMDINLVEKMDKVNNSPSTVHDLSAESLVIRMVSEGKFEDSSAKVIGGIKLQKDNKLLNKEERPINQETPKIERNLNIPLKDHTVNEDVLSKDDSHVNKIKKSCVKNVDINENAKWGDGIPESASKENGTLIPLKDVSKLKKKFMKKNFGTKQKKFKSPLKDSKDELNGYKKTAKLAKELKEVFGEVMKHPASAQFYYNVNVNESRPLPSWKIDLNNLEIDLKSIEMKLDNDIYTNSEQFLEDFRNIARTSIDYFGPMHKVSKAAGKLVDLVGEVVSQLGPSLPSCPRFDLMLSVNDEGIEEGLGRGNKRKSIEAFNEATKRSRDDSADHVCEECGTIFARLSSYTRHCKTKTGCVKSLDRGKKMIGHQMEAQKTAQSFLSKDKIKKVSNKPTLQKVKQTEKSKNINQVRCLECNLQFSSEEALDDHIELDWPGCGEFSKQTSDDKDKEDASLSQPPSSSFTKPFSHSPSPSSLKPFSHSPSPDFINPLSRRKGRPKKRPVRIAPIEDNTVVDDDDNFEPPGLLVRSVDVVANNTMILK